MTHRILPAATAMLFVAGTALAQTPPAPPPDHPSAKAMLKDRAAETCRDGPARAAGEVATLEARLQLTEKQKPLFERWKKVKLAAARSADCAPPSNDAPSVIDALKHEETILRQRLDELKAEQPALEALFASLTDEQKKAFSPPPHRRGPGRPAPMGPPGGHDGVPPPPEN
jgi:hypothetical protein